jgi:hypothetical protein
MGGSPQAVDAYQASIIGMAGMFASIYVVQVLLQRVDESGGLGSPPWLRGFPGHAGSSATP